MNNSYYHSIKALFGNTVFLAYLLSNSLPRIESEKEREVAVVGGF